MSGRAVVSSSKKRRTRRRRGRVGRRVSDGVHVISPDPPVIELQPYMNMVLVMGVTSGNVTLHQIAGRIAKQLDPDGKTLTWSSETNPVLNGYLCFRFHELKVYGPVGSGFAVTVYDYAAPAKDETAVFATGFDAGTVSRPAALGFRFPQKLAMSPLAYQRGSKDKNIFRIYAEGKVLFYLHLSFRFWPGESYSPLNMIDFSLNAERNRTLDTMSRLLGSLEKSQPSTIETTIHGVRKLASLVAAFAAMGEDSPRPETSRGNVRPTTPALESLSSDDVEDVFKDMSL